MTNFNLGEVLTRSWQITWKHKVLWVFGFFSLFAGGGGNGGGGGGNSGYEYESGEAPLPVEPLESGAGEFFQFIEQNLWIVVVFVLFIIALSLLLYALGIMGRIGLIRGVHQVEQGAERLAFGELWSESMPYFWRIFGLNFLIGLAVVLLVVPMVLFGVLTAGVGFLCILPLLCVLIPLIWVVMVILQQAQAAIVVDNTGMWYGFKRGWEIVKTNAVNFILLGLILMLGGAILAFIIALPIVFAVVPLVLGAEALEESLVPVYLAAACCLAYLPVLYFLNSILAAYIQSAWTLTYLRLTQPSTHTPVFAGENA
jgi:hypothetical protein